MITARRWLVLGCLAVLTVGCELGQSTVDSYDDEGDSLEPFSAGTGLKGEYFDNADLTALKVTRVDARISFDWGYGSPDPQIGAETFGPLDRRHRAARWRSLYILHAVG